ncbi:MAG: hypothetical protein JXB26_06390, partial [Candidatus Aminicenantes bacterium]|nr:hypothetical protein [Candidatus Aminicenantes bacterium]
MGEKKKFIIALIFFVLSSIFVLFVQKDQKIVRFSKELCGLSNKYWKISYNKKKMARDILLYLKHTTRSFFDYLNSPDFFLFSMKMLKQMGLDSWNRGEVITSIIYFQK